VKPEFLLNLTEREIEIVHEMSQKVLEQEKLLTTVSDLCGEVDRYELASIRETQY
jgi:hypothetical protein